MVLGEAPPAGPGGGSRSARPHLKRTCGAAPVSRCNRAFRRVSSRSGVAAEAPGGVHLGKTG
jgi:hypothetical protein